MIGTISEEIKLAVDDLQRCAPNYEPALERFALRLQQGWAEGLHLTDDETVELHRKLAAYHAKLARAPVLDIIHEHHEHLAEMLAIEADAIPRRAAASKRIEAHFAGVPDALSLPDDADYDERMRMHRIEQGE